MGLAGGASEVAWIAMYAQLSGSDAAVVARGITNSLFPWIQTTSMDAPLGVAIHMSLAVLLGIAIATVLQARFPRVSGTAREPVIIVMVLIAVWATNFFLVLPAINPAFVTLVPYGVSLISKVLFGFAAALVLHLHHEPHPVAKTVAKGNL